MLFRVSVDLTDARPLFDETEDVNCQHLLACKLWITVAALPLVHRGQLASVAAAEEQVDPNKCRGSVHVAKGGLQEKFLV